MDEDQFWKLLGSELPAFPHYVEHEFVVPVELRDVRYGIRAFQHPDLVENELALNPNSCEIFARWIVPQQIRIRRLLPN